MSGLAIVALLLSAAFDGAVDLAGQLAPSRYASVAALAPDPYAGALDAARVDLAPNPYGSVAGLAPDPYVDAVAMVLAPSPYESLPGLAPDPYVSGSGVAGPPSLAPPPYRAPVKARGARGRAVDLASSPY